MTIADSRRRGRVWPTCPICGHMLRVAGPNGRYVAVEQCQRPDLHWTAESLAADARRREERHAARVRAARIGYIIAPHPIRGGHPTTERTPR